VEPDEEPRVIYDLGDDYFVRPLDVADLDGPYGKWFEDQEICRYNSHGKFFKTRASLQTYLSELDRPDRIVWAICHRTDGHIGNISLQEISFIDRTAEFAIIIGDRRHWNKGVGLRAGRKLLEHGFNKLNLERIHCGVAATNTGMNRLALAFGMKHEGTRREHLFLEGERVDMLEYGILRPEFASTSASAKKS
jgi:[ribosomal protein S5]-alanine N-acetyltransferase